MRYDLEDLEDFVLLLLAVKSELFCFKFIFVIYTPLTLHRAD